MRRPLVVCTVGLSLSTGALGQGPSDPILTNLPVLFSVSDYPVGAAVKQIEGTATVDLLVGPDGMVKSCTIKQSSGDQELDVQSCWIFRTRALFVAARDREGRFIDGHFSKPVTWRLEEAEPGDDRRFPRAPWAMRFTTLYNDKGNVIDCAVTGAGVQPPDNPCADWASSDDFKRLSAADRTAGVRTINDIQFFAGAFDQAKVAPERPDGRRVGRKVSELEIRADGTITACLDLEDSRGNEPSYDLCMTAPRVHFTPSGGPGAEKATVIITTYAFKA
ncbi:MAG: TonB family protein [Sphingomicrobium sp.]